ncbi:hypothetical protein EV143_103391 [Flavobacterium chryseum]|uniref:hypothetical protein n=1 Tax=Flavobacterium sp. P3160 TaxID=2512113 RepID=UPI00105D525B|nr:hypothetical protein [Flavobacterium sp. P3160]TDO78140.1 hypothetical protein EV143_103391 [Flavobacterium sp. P3160]
MIFKTITKPKIFLISLVSLTLAIYLSFSIFAKKAFEAYFWIPILIYLMIQYYLFYISRKTEIRKTALINLIISSILGVFLTLLLLYFIAMRMVIGSTMKG